MEPTKEVKEKLKHIAEQITQITGFGPLHVNDILPEIRQAFALGQQDARDIIEAECEWVKEDVADGNDGYFIVRNSVLKSLSPKEEND